MKLEPKTRILIYRQCPAFGRMYLCADGSTTTDRLQAQEFWAMQFDEVVSTNWIVRPAQIEVVTSSQNIIDSLARVEVEEVFNDDKINPLGRW